MRSHKTLGETVCDDKLKDALLLDPATADISENDRLMLCFAARLTGEPKTLDAAYVDNMKQHGFDDRLIHDIVQVTAYFNYINRLADGLGIELEG